MKDTVLSYPFIDIHVDERDELTLVLLEFDLMAPLAATLNVENGYANATGNNDLKSSFSLFESLFAEIMNSLGSFSGVRWHKLSSISPLGASGFTISFASGNGSHCVFRFYGKRSKLTVDIQGSVSEEAGVFLLKNLEKLIDGIQSKLGATSSRLIATVPRGGTVNNLFFTSDQRLTVYDFDSLVYKATSPHQQICIQHSKRFGNTLILDDFVNLAEGDILYTHSIMRKGTECYKDKEVLILGGGDGGILHEVLKENPGMVTMVEIDRMVMDACRIHLRGACGDTLDVMKGPNHEIITGDCFPFMESCLKENHRFDYVFGDLTDCPLIADSDSSKSAESEFWTLTRRVLVSVMPLLKPGGKFLTHLTSVSAVGVIAQYEAMLTGLGLRFEQTSSHVPSFQETWLFYTIWECPTISA